MSAWPNTNTIPSPPPTPIPSLFLPFFHSLQVSHLPSLPFTAPPPSYLPVFPSLPFIREGEREGENKGGELERRRDDGKMEKEGMQGAGKGEV